MPIPKKYLADFNEHGIYHVYNRTNNREQLFLTDENRYFFLEKYMSYLSPVLDTYCWCLLSNHFHSLIKIKQEEVIRNFLQNKLFGELSITEKKFLDNKTGLGVLIEHTFKRFFQSYSQSFNNMFDRSGNLFYRPFKRVEIEKDIQFTRSVVYIHTNPVKHELTSDFKTYPWSSWNHLVSEEPTTLLRNELWHWFGDKESFISMHDNMHAACYENRFAIEQLL